MLVNIRPRISAPYGAVDSVHTSPHTGVDVAVPVGTPLHAASDSVVSRVVEEGTSRLGNGVILHTPDGHDIIYGHMSRITVHPGEHLRAGEVIGLSGNTGHSTGPHLHLGAMHDGHFVNPTGLINAALGEVPKPKSHSGPFGGLQDALEQFNQFMQCIGDFFQKVGYWLNPGNLWRELSEVFASGTLDTPLIVGTIVGIILMMGGASWPKKWLFWGWAVFWFMRGVVFG